jgi:pantetheine-phosphate adenylyltransferase
MKRALIAGTFDPPSLGHLDIIQRASRLCDHLIIGIAVNPAKQAAFTVEERMEMLLSAASSLSNIKIVAFTGLVVDFAREHQIACLIRGLRSFADLDRELQLAAMNKQLSGIETFLLPGNPLYAPISSSLIRELAFNQAPLDQLVPHEIIAKVLARFKK